MTNNKNENFPSLFVAVSQLACWAVFSLKNSGVILSCLIKVSVEEFRDEKKCNNPQKKIEYKNSKG